MSKFKSKFEEDVAIFYSIEDFYEKDKLKYVLENTYTPDFTVAENVFIESKGFWKPSDRRKMLEVIKQYPQAKFIMFFMDSSVKITRRSKTNYGDWCDKHNIEWYCWKYKRPTKRIFNLACGTTSNQSI